MRSGEGRIGRIGRTGRTGTGTKDGRVGARVANGTSMSDRDPREGTGLTGPGRPLEAAGDDKESDRDGRTERPV